MMLALSTTWVIKFYTYWYLTAVPELMALAGDKFSASPISRETAMSKHPRRHHHLPRSCKLTLPST
jgi:hypothetical protein